MTTFFVPGRPRPQGSKRAFVNKGRAVMVESSKGVGDWRGDVKAFAVAAHEGPPLEGPVDVVLSFYLPRPKSHPKTRATWPVARPDVDKLARAILDAITGVCFKDDSQVVSLHARKVWDLAEEHQRSGVGVVVRGSDLPGFVSALLSEWGGE